MSLLVVYGTERETASFDISKVEIPFQKVLYATEKYWKGEVENGATGVCVISGRVNEIHKVYRAYFDLKWSMGDGNAEDYHIVPSPVDPIPARDPAVEKQKAQRNRINEQIAAGLMPAISSAATSVVEAAETASSEPTPSPSASPKATRK